MFNNTNVNFNQMLIWKKPMLLGRNRYQYSYEPCIFAIKGSPYFTQDRTKTTVWDFGGYDKSKNIHPTQKPLFLPTEAIMNSSKTNDIILDLFGGSGSTLIACEQTNRICYMMELDEKYCDVILARWEKLTGKQAIKIEGGEDNGRTIIE
jgi:site-specific DNA-methyltransferase (adenine-specific)